MDRPSAVGEFLRARRSALRPEDVGLPAGGNRRVEGLRREEVADLARISPEYYLRLEQGRDHQPSDQVLGALADALRLDATSRTYLERLVRRPLAQTAPDHRSPGVADELAGVLDQWQETPAFVVDGNLDVVQSNRLADALGQGRMSPGANRLQVMFEDGAQAVIPEWELRVQELVGALRMTSDPDDPRLQELVGGLSVSSPEFRRAWARQEVHVFVEGDCYSFVEPFGVVRLWWRNFAVEGYPGLALTTIYAKPGTPAVGVLAYCAANAGPPGRAPGTGQRA